jgi:hypothetical protein
MPNKITVLPRHSVAVLGHLMAFLILAFPAWAASVSQRTEGSCSPAVADVKGDVKLSIVCEGVDPALLNEIVKLLNEILKDTKKLDQIKQELDKSSKRTEQIEQRLADRTLSDVQVRIIAGTITPFAGQEFQITTFWQLKEPLAIANGIFHVLNLAGWKHIKPASHEFLVEPMTGVRVYVHPVADERAKKAADSLVSVLTKEGIASELRQVNDPQNPNNKLYINVGTKP